ncbi:MAG: S1 RNA-binding domain-containing protein, partial [Candidatus Obscuribacterales bacterium]|nr:S1 RNA-binding domain-containing protein [Candidatus Obscuribacterales bacterium]
GEADELQVGATYTFIVTSEPDDEGACNLSQKRASVWLQLRQKQESGEFDLAKVYAIATSRGGRVSGVKANIHGVRAFIPRSEILYFGKMEDLLDKEVPVKVLEADPAKGRFGECILSQLKAVEAEQDGYLNDLTIGETVTGVVRKLIGAGVLVDLGDRVTGLIRRCELCGDRSIDPGKVVRIGETIKVKVVSVETEKRKVFLSRRAVLQDDFLPTIKEGAVLSGIVARSENFGAFVCLGDCVDGLLHISDFRGAGTASAGSPSELFVVGQEIEVQIKALDLTRMRISLTRQFEAPASVSDKTVA